MDAAEVAELLGVPTGWVYEQSRKGLIPRSGLAATGASAARGWSGGSRLTKTGAAQVWAAPLVP
jgi:hypothetical protein